jgi:hypothetical protein
MEAARRRAVNQPGAIGAALDQAVAGIALRAPHLVSREV